jgi:hypothetical protein
MERATGQQMCSGPLAPGFVAFPLGEGESDIVSIQCACPSETERGGVYLRCFRRRCSSTNRSARAVFRRAGKDPGDKIAVASAD